MNSPTIARHTFWLIPTSLQWLFYILMALAFLWTLWRGYLLLRVWRSSQPGGYAGLQGKSVRAALGAVFGQQKLRRDPAAGLMHLLVFYGFLILMIGSGLVALDHDFGLHFLQGTVYLIYELVLDVAGLALLVGLGMAFWRRYVQRVQRLENSFAITAFLWLLLAITLSGFGAEAARMAAMQPDFAIWSPLGFGLAALLQMLLPAVSDWQTVYLAFWWLHVALIFVFFASAFDLFTRHIILVPANLLASASAATEPALPPVPTNTLKDLRWPYLLAASACTTCGRCQAACPAMASGKPLDPRRVAGKLRHALDQVISGNSDGNLLGTVSADELWSCTTCGACAFECPAGVSPLGLIREMRGLVVEQGELPAMPARALENILHRGDPWGNPQSRRLDWLGNRKAPVVAADDERVELLYWVGCAGAFEPAAQHVSRAMVSLLEKAGASYAVFGSNERCCGDPARSLGEEGLFEKVARANIAAFQRHGVRKIVTACAHCLDILKNEYPRYGADIEVVHHSQYLAELLDAGALSPQREHVRKVTLHDPCYLGRHNGEFQAPRFLLAAMPGAELTEMPRRGDRSFCCGGGGGHAWMNIPIGQRMDDLRIAEAAATGAEVVATACPFCKIMLDSAGAATEAETTLRVRDIAELLDENT